MFKRKTGVTAAYIFLSNLSNAILASGWDNIKLKKILKIDQ